jgi:hypothetical protein
MKFFKIYFVVLLLQVRNCFAIDRIARERLPFCQLIAAQHSTNHWLMIVKMGGRERKSAMLAILSDFRQFRGTK